MQMKFKYLNNFFKGKRMIADKLIERFTNFFTRSVAPSSIFFVLLYFNDMFFNDGCLFCDFQIFLNNAKSIHDVFLYICLVLLFLAYGYINQIFSQFLDNLIKKNYCIFSNRFFEKCCDGEYRKLKLRVNEKLTKKENAIFSAIDFNDYNAYQVLGKEVKIASSYVDEIKSIHSFALALGFNLFMYFFYFSSTYELCLFVVLFLSVFISSHMIAKSRYKARNKRLYINYLLKEDKKDKCEKEIKIKSIKVEIDE
jgi:hypothetical protein